LVHSLPALHAAHAAPPLPQSALAVPGSQTPLALQQPFGHVDALHLVHSVDTSPPDCAAAVGFAAALPGWPQAVKQTSNAAIAIRKSTQVPRFITTPPCDTKNETESTQIMTGSRCRV
jgi:hypothetical protein